MEGGGRYVSARHGDEELLERGLDGLWLAMEPTRVHFSVLRYKQKGPRVKHRVY